MWSVASRLAATLYAYQTFQRQRGWLQALCGWSWNSMFCTAVITSVSHKQGRAPRQQQGRALCLSICTHKKVLWNFIHGRRGHICLPISAGPVLISLSLTLQPSLATSWCCAIYPCAHSVPHSARWNKNKRKPEKPQEHPWEINACVGKHLPNSPSLSANKLYSPTNIWAPNDTGRRGLKSKYREHSGVGKSGFHPFMALAQSRLT